MATSDIKAENVTEQATRDWQQGKSLGGCMEEMFTRGLWTDVKFYCKGNEAGETILAHKIVLSARSPVFQAMFFGPCADEKAEIVLKDVEKDAFLLFIKYIYSDTVQLNEENVFDVIALAHLYQVSSLVTFCADYLANIITPNNACEILTCAMLYQLSELKGACCVFIDSHAKQILVSEGFMNLSPDCLLYILKGDTFFAKEEHILKMADKWSRKRVLESGEEETGANIRKGLGDSFFQLRLPTLSNRSLLDHISRKGYFSVEEYADIAGYINNTPGVSEYTNSCVERVPEVVTVTVDPHEKNQSIERNQSISVSESVFVSLEISSKKDVALTNLVLGDIKPYMKSKIPLFTIKNTGEDIENRHMFNYLGSILIKHECGRFRKECCLENCKPTKEIQLPENLRLELSGSITIKSLDFEQKFNVQQLQDSNSVVTLTPALLLKRREAPYLIEVTLQYGCGGPICIGTKYVEEKAYYRRHYHKPGISVECVKGAFRVIKSLEFKNFSNR